MQLPLRLITGNWRPRREGRGEGEMRLRVLLNSASSEAEWPGSRSGRFVVEGGQMQVA
jgi:hypothetical protein